jgi:hypothetical protein
LPAIAFGIGYRCEDAMQQYEIHVGKDDRNRRIYPCLQLNDHAAIRRAQSLAKQFEEVEVWRAEVCVYARAAQMQGSAHGKI